MADVNVVADEAAVADAAARAAVGDLEAALARREVVTWVLTGGSTPQAAYRCLAAPELRERLDWSRIRVAMGDERLAPPDHPESNWGQAAAGLLDHVPVPEALRMRLRGELPGEQAAAEYEELLAALPQAGGAPRLELVWLGVGPDGHCLSLFPGRPETEVRDRLVVPVHGAPKPPPDRVSLTLPALAGTERLFILAAGAEKADAIARARAGDDALPLTRAVATVEQGGGKVAWLLDAAAAGA